MGRKRLNETKAYEINAIETLTCLRCNKELNIKEFYHSASEFYKSTNKMPYCKECIEDLYDVILDKYTKLGYLNAERKAVERVCMALDIYYDDEVFDKAINDEKFKASSVMPMYMKNVSLTQYRKYNYDDTIYNKYKNMKLNNGSYDNSMSISIEHDAMTKAEMDKAEEFFGSGFDKDDYVYLQEQYNDWITRHECQTKSQEELFKQICFAQLNLYKAQRLGEDTRDLNRTYLDLLNAAKLQPKQNSGESMADNQTFGTLIDKYENTRPLPEIDEDLRDVDKIGLYLDVFFRGHLAKMMGLKNGLSNLYTKYMKKYTVEKPEYEDDADGEALFDAIFGGSNLDDNED